MALVDVLILSGLRLVPALSVLLLDGRSSSCLFSGADLIRRPRICTKKYEQFVLKMYRQNPWSTSIPEENVKEKRIDVFFTACRMRVTAPFINIQNQPPGQRYMRR